MTKYDFDNHEYSPVRDGEERARIRKLCGVKNEWSIYRRNGDRIRLVSSTHDDDVEMVLSGNFDDAQAMAVAEEICEQLNAAERKFDEDV